MQKKVTIEQVGVASVGKLFGTVQAIIGLAVGLVAAIVGAISVSDNYEFSTLTDIGITIGFILLGTIVYPTILFLFGWLYGALTALVFNIFIGVSGGLELQVTESKLDDAAVSKK